MRADRSLTRLRYHYCPGTSIEACGRTILFEQLGRELCGDDHLGMTSVRYRTLEKRAARKQDARKAPSTHTHVRAPASFVPGVRSG